MSGILLATNFTVGSAIPLDDRDVVSNLPARNLIQSFRRYEGMKVYVVAEQKNYQLIGGITNADWVEDTAGTGGGGGGTTTGSGGWEEALTGAIDEYGNYAITLRALIDKIILEDEVGIKWAMTVSNAGEIEISDTGAGSALPEVLLVRDDMTTVSLKIRNNEIISDTIIGTGEVIAVCYLKAASGMAWRLRVNNSGDAYLEDGAGNTWTIRDQLGGLLYRISQTVDGTLFESRACHGNPPAPASDPNTVRHTFQIIDGVPYLKIWDESTSTWRTLQYTNTFSDPFPVGSVISSFLTTTEFLTEMQDPTGARWKLLKSDTIPKDSRLAIIKGWKSIPNAQGMALRGLDTSAVLDPDVDTRIKHEDGQLGSYQDDCFQNVYGDFAFTDDNATDYRIRVAQAVGAFYGIATTTLSLSPAGGSVPGGTATHVGFDTSRVCRTSTETRMKNIAVNYFVKYNK